MIINLTPYKSNQKKCVGLKIPFNSLGSKIFYMWAGMEVGIYYFKKNINLIV